MKNKKKKISIKTECPVCKKECSLSGIRNHIINSAKNEVWKNKPTPHKDYLENNKIVIDKEKIQFISKE